VFCHVLRKRTLHNVNHQHENIQILQLLLNTYIHHCVKHRSRTNDISEWERHCQQNLRVAAEGNRTSSIRMNEPQCELSATVAIKKLTSYTKAQPKAFNWRTTLTKHSLSLVLQMTITLTQLQLQARMNCNWLQLDYKQNCEWPKSDLHLSTQLLKHVARPTSEWNKNKYIQTHLADSQAYNSHSRHLQMWMPLSSKVKSTFKHWMKHKCKFLSICTWTVTWGKCC